MVREERHEDLLGDVRPAHEAEVVPGPAADAGLQLGEDARVQRLRRYALVARQGDAQVPDAGRVRDEGDASDGLHSADGGCSADSQALRFGPLQPAAGGRAVQGHAAVQDDAAVLYAGRVDGGVVCVLVNGRRRLPRRQPQLLESACARGLPHVRCQRLTG